MSDLRDVFVVGAGPSAFAFVSGLRNSGFAGNITIFSGENRDAIISRDIFNLRGVSPKQLQDKFIDSVDGFTYSNGAFYALSTLGIGGGARFWGASIAGFDSYSIKRNGLDYDKYRKNLKAINGLFGVSTHSGAKKSFFDDSVMCILNESDFLNIGPPNLAVEKNLCTMCGRCIAGCPYDAIWAPTINDFKELNVRIVSDYITSLGAVDGVVSSALGLSGQDYPINGDIFLALNPISFYKLISSTFTSTSASIGVTPSIAFAIPRFSKPASQFYFGMGIATLKIIQESRTMAYGNIYDGRSLSHSDIKIFSTHNNFLDSLKKRLVRNFWLGLLFTSSDNVDCRINSHGIIDVVDQSAVQTFSYIKKVVRKSVDWYRPIYFNLVKPGADLHYCNGVPDNISIDSETGKMEAIDNLFVVGAPNFKYLPPESPTMSFMANSYGVAVEYVAQ